MTVDQSVDRGVEPRSQQSRVAMHAFWKTETFPQIGWKNRIVTKTSTEIQENGMGLLVTVGICRFVVHTGGKAVVWLIETLISRKTTELSEISQEYIGAGWKELK